MPPEPHDLTYLADMLNASERAVRLVDGKTFDEYILDDTVKLAAERLIEIIGEAARNVSRPFQDAHPKIPWRLMIAQRHVLAHDYGIIEHDRIWRILQQHIPALVSQLRVLLPDDLDDVAQ